MSDTIDPTVVITPEAIMSFPHLDQPQAPQKPTDKAKYSGAFIFLTKDVLKAMEAAATAAAVAKFGPAKGPSMVTFGGKGATFRTDGKAGYPAGSIFVNARSEQKPGLYYTYAGLKKHPVTGKPLPAEIPEDKVREELYPGAIVRAYLRAYGYDTQGNKGISWSLNGVQKIRDGERLDSRVKAEEMFNADLSETPADLAGLI